MEKKKILYINIDGFSYSYFEQLMELEPNGPFARLAEEGMLFTNLHSGLISITNPMQSAILCGAWSNRTRNFYQHYDWKRGEVIKHART
ncbi:MAG: alkaline phosphatase family protein, partial [Tyzzerella sp.]|nr:alkaline phosphatase family protein [Tyzzerella sp.]